MTRISKQGISGLKGGTDVQQATTLLRKALRAIDTRAFVGHIAFDAPDDEVRYRNVKRKYQQDDTFFVRKPWHMAHTLVYTVSQL